MNTFRLKIIKIPQKALKTGLLDIPIGLDPKLVFIYHTQIQGNLLYVFYDHREVKK